MNNAKKIGENNRMGKIRNLFRETGNIKGTFHECSYAILLFTALDLASITSHIHNWVDTRLDEVSLAL